MEKYNWRDDPELRVWLMDSAPAPIAVRSPKFDSLFRFVIRKKNGTMEVKNFVPEWAVPIVETILNKDESVRDYFYNMTYKGT